MLSSPLCIAAVVMCAFPLQFRSPSAIQERMLRLTDMDQASADEPAADALLCLSGSHPARKLPGSSRFVSGFFTAKTPPQQQPVAAHSENMSNHRSCVQRSQCARCHVPPLQVAGE